MTSPAAEAAWERHHREWRDPLAVAAHWSEAGTADPALFVARERGAFWATLAELGVTVFVTREYEHLILALSVVDGKPRTSYLRLPHPSGLVVDRKRQRVFVASTRNPNQIFTLAPAGELLRRPDVGRHDLGGRPLLPFRSQFYPGSLYVHDIALIGDELHANAVGHNAVARLHDDGSYEYVWWPRCVEKQGKPVFAPNYIQLNSIAAGATLTDSYFSASSDSMGSRRPGHRNYPVDGRGVVFSGKTREVFARGLTRPHSARLHDRKVWVDNSGYGQLGICRDGKFDPVVQLPGWTRGLGFVGRYAIVGTSKVIPRFRKYAPGLSVEKSRCGLHIVDLRSGQIVGSLEWKNGSQLFAIDWAPQRMTKGFLFTPGRRAKERERDVFYAYKLG